MLIDRGRQAVVVDSNRFGPPGATPNLLLIDTQRALAGKPALLGTLPSGAFPRELTVEPNRDTVLVANFDSSQLEVVDFATSTAR